MADKPKCSFCEEDTYTVLINHRSHKICDGCIALAAARVISHPDCRQNFVANMFPSSILMKKMLSVLNNPHPLAPHNDSLVEKFLDFLVLQARPKPERKPAETKAVHEANNAFAQALAAAHHLELVDLFAMEKNMRIVLEKQDVIAQLSRRHEMLVTHRGSDTRIAIVIANPISIANMDRIEDQVSSALLWATSFSFVIAPRHEIMQRIEEAYGHIA